MTSPVLIRYSLEFIYNLGIAFKIDFRHLAMYTECEYQKLNNLNNLDLL